jgi:hypothetical protein
VRDAAYAALAAVGKDAMHFRPPEEQNDHKVTCGVRADVLDAVATGIRRDLDAANVQANVIISGEGASVCTCPSMHVCGLALCAHCIVSCLEWAGGRGECVILHLGVAVWRSLHNQLAACLHTA